MPLIRSETTPTITTALSSRRRRATLGVTTAATSGPCCSLALILVYGVLVALSFDLIRLGAATPTSIPLSPTVQSKPPKQQQQLDTSSANTIKPTNSIEKPQPQQLQLQLESKPEPELPQQPQQQVQAPSGKQLARPLNNVEKLKRGLTSFMNQLNAAPFFVPPQQLGGPMLTSAAAAGVKSNGTGVAAQSSSAEPAALINGDPTADVLIKGPNRLTQTRPIGNPLRWGRRR